MFGGYCEYIDGNVVGLVCDGRGFVKCSGADRTLAGYAEPAPAYPGARNSRRLPTDALRDEPERVVGIFRSTADALPVRSARTGR